MCAADEQNALFLLFLYTTPCVFLLLVPRPVLWLMCDDESRPWAGVRGPLPFFCFLLRAACREGDDRGGGAEFESANKENN